MLAMREVDFPRRGPGYLDLARADAAIATAANQWLADNIELYEGDARLPYPTPRRSAGIGAIRPSFASCEQALAHVHWTQAAE